MVRLQVSRLDKNNLVRIVHSFIYIELIEYCGKNLLCWRLGGFDGAWLSFSGEGGKGGWGRTRLKEIIPVECLGTDDLVESTEGFFPVAESKWLHHFRGINLNDIPPILGYNQTKEREGFDTILRIKETSDPLLVFGKIGKGKVLAYMSDPAPHWGCNFVYWEHYNSFWLKCLELVL